MKGNGGKNQRLGRPLKGRSRRAPITVHVPTGLLDAIDEYVEQRNGEEVFSRSDFFCEAALEYMRKLGLDAGAAEEYVRLERTKNVPEKSEDTETLDNTDK